MHGGRGDITFFCINPPFQNVRFRHSSDEEIQNFVDKNITPLEGALSPEADLRYPETDASNQKNENFHIPESLVMIGSKREKYRRNVTAISLVNALQAETRSATPEEQLTLARYSGWGGIPEAFDPRNDSWSKEFSELSALLTPEEYKAARSSTLTAFYTEPPLIRAIWDGVTAMGFSGGKILDPAAGTGNFFGAMPAYLEKSSLTAVELDPITGQILKNLYPNAEVRIEGFEKTKIPDGHFDLAIGNVPFGDFSLFDERYRNENFRGTSFLIHDYFFAKALDKVHPGGLVVFFTSTGTMDKTNSSVRRYLAKRAELVGAVRLPNNAFKALGGTEVTADLLVLQKRPLPLDIEPDWTQLGKYKGIPINQYFADHPENILGTLSMISGQYGMEPACLPNPDIDLPLAVRTALTKMSETAHYYGKETAPTIPQEIPQTLPPLLGIKKFSYAVVNKALYYREDGSLILQPQITGKKLERIVGMCGIRDAVRSIINLQLTEDYDTADLERAQQLLHEQYDAFVKKNGYLNDSVNLSAFDEDSESPLLASIEEVNREAETVTKAAIFYKATIRPKKEYRISSPEDALIVCLNEKNHIDTDYLAILCAPLGLDPLNALAAQNLLYKNPATEVWELESEYLSGNVKDKLHYAELVAKQNPEYERNVKALTAVQPEPLPFHLIDFQLGSIWIPEDYYRNFCYEIMQTPKFSQGTSRGSIYLSYEKFTSRWTIHNKQNHKGVIVTGKYGTPRKSGYELLEDALNLNTPTVFDLKTVEGKERRVLNNAETTAARLKQDVIKQAFKEWIFSDVERVKELTQIYNERFNKFVTRKFDGSTLSFDGMSAEIELRDSQRDAVARIVQGDSSLIAHPVGAGKTYTLIAGAMKLKQTGTVRKPLFIVPNHLTTQWGADFLKLYPSANVLMASKSDFSTNSRKGFLAKMATGDYDAIILAHSQFGRIPMSEEYQEKVINAQIEEMENALFELEGDDTAKFTVKNIERAKKQLEEKLLTLNTVLRKDDVLTFEEMGIDQIFVDESHYFKNCFVNTKISGVSGITVSPAAKSLDMLMKCHYLDEIREGKGVVFATGTAISILRNELPHHYRKNLPKDQPVLLKKAPKEMGFALPPKNPEGYRRMFAYLVKTRCIAPSVVQGLINRKLLYEDEHHNCAFVSMDEGGKPRYCALRGTYTPEGQKPFKLEVNGSDKSVGWYVNNNSTRLFVVEAPIEAMSIMTILALHQKNFESYNYLAIGTNCSTKSLSRWVAAAEPPIEMVYLSLNNDEAGKKGMEKLRNALKTDLDFTGRIVDKLPVHKDFNDDLKALSEEKKKQIAEKKGLEHE